MIPQKLDQVYRGAQPFLWRLKENVGQTLGGFADSRNYPISGRIKTINSLAEKIETGRYAKFSEIDDLVAFSIIIPNALAENEVRQFCNEKFLVVELKDKTTSEKSPDVFRFDSTRVIAKLRRPLAFDEDTIRSIYDFRFEIQIRTAFEHAWSVATHDLAYKSSSMDWRRLRLAAQLKAMTEGMDVAVAAFEPMAAAISISPWSKMDDRQAVCNAIDRMISEKILPFELIPSSSSRFSENLCYLIKNIQPKRTVLECLNVILEEIKKGDRVPISLSLYQICLGILFHRGLATGVGKIRCHVGEELNVFFPKVSVEFPFIYDQ
jgi:ppGpp synthetase/RelA/SpoT-type nucleotidyltranferase